MDQTLVVTRRLRAHPQDSFTIDRYLATGGYEALRKILRELAPERVVQLVKESGLRGRGGAGFGTGQKWSFIPEDITPRYVVVNNDEGEPCTFKDREISEGDPHAIIEGALICAYAVRAQAVYIYCRGEFGLGIRRIERALAEARRAGLVGRDIAGSGFDCPVYLHPGAGAYICGEETALLDSLEGLRGQPRLRPPFFPAVKGLYNQPTVVNNTETLASLPPIISGGVEWWRSMGTKESPGVKVFSVSGGVERPGNYEFPLGIPMQTLLDAAGGLREGRALKAVIPGGASAPWLDHSEITMDFESLAEAGTMLGSGSVIFLDSGACPVRVAYISTRFFNHESCGKCTPCREGTWWLVKILERIEGGEGRPEDVDLLVEICNNMSDSAPRYAPMGRCFCALGDAAAWSLRSAVELFEDDFRRHVSERRCPYEADAVAVSA